MDEGTLNDLLECSVCLERLDTSSKVLPCQHTFCRKCLEEIVQKHKELRCPECRILVNLKIDDLPPNVLLMRILEGMRNAIPKKQQRTTRIHHQQQQLQQQQQQQQQHQQQLNPIQVQVQHLGTPERLINNQNSPHLIPHQPYAKAKYDYGSKEAGDLNFKRGDIIILRKRIDSHWYQGECGGKQGAFPLSYVQIITPLPSHVPQCKALYDFRMNNDEEEGCLAFNKGDIINVIRRVDENWAEGKLDGRIGIFPLAFVELNNLARSLMKLSTNVQPGPSKVAPPTPTTDDSTPLIPTDHSKTVISQHQIQGLITPDSSSGSSSTPNVSSSNTSSTSSTAPSSPATPPPRNQPLPPRSVPQKPDILQNSSACSTPQRSPNTSVQDSRNGQNKEKRHSFTSSLTPQHHSKSNHRHSAEIAFEDVQNRVRNFQTAVGATAAAPPSITSTGPNDVPLPAAYIALYPYKPQKCDELELRKGGVYMVTERCQDGWYKGTSNRTQKTGVFPGNYVVLARSVNGPRGETSSSSSAAATTTVSFTRNGKSVSSAAIQQRQVSCLPPELPPRSVSPAIATNNTISSSWHGQQDNASVPLGRSSSAIMPTNAQKPAEKNKDRKEKGTVSLMRRLTSIKRSKSPPPSSYSMDNPVFEDSVNVPSIAAHPVHVRSTETAAAAGGSSNSTPDVHHHRKSNSLDAGRTIGVTPSSVAVTTTTTPPSRTTAVQTVRERFRCITPYPPNSEYELELQINDIIYVHKKRDDGWYKGTQQRTGRTGLFPASFVESF